MRTPAEVMAALPATGTCHDALSQQLAAIRTWFDTPSGEAYLASLRAEITAEDGKHLLGQIAVS